MLCGIVNLEKNGTVAPAWVKETKNIFYHFSNNLDVVEESLPSACFLRANTKSLTQYDGITKKNGIISAIAGEPLLTKNGIEIDHQVLSESLYNGDIEDLQRTRGVFFTVLFSSIDKPKLIICGDKLGIRPVYYWTNGVIVVFSSLFKAIEKLSFVSKIADEVALSEIIVFGCPFGSRTKYKDVKILREAEIVSFTITKCTSTQYWSWASVPKREISIKEATSEAYKIFKEAVSIRLHGDTCVPAFLSGGMDSRAIVGAIKDLGKKAYLLNFSPTRSQDQVLAQEFATKIDFPLSLTPRDGLLPMGFRRHLARLAGTLVLDNKMKVNRPRSIWSGDGGSVSVGCVYIDEAIVEKMRSGATKEAVDLYKVKNSYSLPFGVLKRKKLDVFSSLVDTSILSEIERIPCEDRANAIFLFLMFNDQRRHLNDFYEDLNEHVIEYQLPFFDGVFLEYLFSLPLDFRINHNFYNEWFKEFPDAVTSVPWQTYPGHVPCPLPIDPELIYQWEGKKLGLKQKIGKCIAEGAQGFQLVAGVHGIGPVSRIRLFFASLIHLFGVRDYGYVIRAAAVYKEGLR